MAMCRREGRSGSPEVHVHVLSSVVHPVAASLLLLLALARVGGHVLARVVLAPKVLVREHLG